jgi:hypothetical protein
MTKIFSPLMYGLPLLLLSITCSAQKLELNDIIKIYTLDSLSLKTFSLEKKFRLDSVGEDHWINSYRFRSVTDPAISFIHTYPKDQSGEVFLYYYFDSKDDYKNFAKQVEKNGFEYIKYYELMPPGSKNKDLRERYDKGRLELELCKTNFGPYKYALLLYRKI